MRRQLTLTVVLTAAVLLGVWASSPGTERAAAQNLDEVKKTDEDMGRMLRHPNAYRDELGARRSFRANPEGARYTYKFYDYPKPSFQFFQQGQTYKWSWDLFPGGERRIYPSYDPWPRRYYVPTYNQYSYNNYTYNYYYPPVGYQGW